MKTIVLLRHGESVWNKENRFTGWTDVPLSEKGIQKAREAGRALVKYADRLSDEEVIKVNIPSGIPLVYELSDDLKPMRNYYLGDQESVKKAAEAVAEQSKAK